MTSSTSELPAYVTDPSPTAGSATDFRRRPHLRARRIGSRVILLDLLASRYFMLEGTAAKHFLFFSAGSADAMSLRWLEENGLIERGAAERERPLPSTPTHSLFDEDISRPPSWLVAEALASQLAARRRVSREPLASLLSDHIAIGTIDVDACRTIAAANRSAARYRSARDQCLPNALAMRAMLTRRGLAAELVIGVMLPFAAHCWLQAGDTVLSDPFDSVQNFEPLTAA